MLVAYIVARGWTAVKCQVFQGLGDCQTGKDAGAGVEMFLGDGAKVERQLVTLGPSVSRPRFRGVHYSLLTVIAAEIEVAAGKDAIKYERSIWLQSMRNRLHIAQALR